MVKLGKVREVPLREFIMGGGTGELQNETTSPTALGDPISRPSNELQCRPRLPWTQNVLVLFDPGTTRESLRLFTNDIASSRVQSR